jgi:hypothetical protein
LHEGCEERRADDSYKQWVLERTRR